MYISTVTLFPCLIRSIVTTRFSFTWCVFDLRILFSFQSFRFYCSFFVVVVVVFVINHISVLFAFLVVFFFSINGVHVLPNIDLEAERLFLWVVHYKYITHIAVVGEWVSECVSDQAYVCRPATHARILIKTRRFPGCIWVRCNNLLSVSVLTK